MTAMRSLALATLAALAAATSTRAAGAGQDGKVEVEVYADVRAVAPGATFHLAMQYDIEPDWHIYWVNPGDTGFATTLEVEAPEGFLVGPVQYPGPHRFGDAGDLISFAHEGRATLLVEIKAPETLAPDDRLRFMLRSDWLVCKEACFVGKADKSITLKSVASGEEVKPANATRFAKAQARLPRELKDLKIAQHRWRGSKATPRFEATFPEEVEFEFFPLIVQDVQPHEPEITRLDDGSSRLTVSFDVNEARLWPAGPRSLGVLRVKQGDEEMYFDLVPTVDG